MRLVGEAADMIVAAARDGSRVEGVLATFLSEDENTYLTDDGRRRSHWEIFRTPLTSFDLP